MEKSCESGSSTVTRAAPGSHPATAGGESVSAVAHDWPAATTFLQCANSQGGYWLFNYKTVADFTTQDGITMSDLLVRLHLATSVIRELSRVAYSFTSVCEGPMVELMVLETCLLIYSRGVAEASGRLNQEALDILHSQAELLPRQSASPEQKAQMYGYYLETTMLTRSQCRSQARVHPSCTPPGSERPLVDDITPRASLKRGSGDAQEPTKARRSEQHTTPRGGLIQATITPRSAFPNTSIIAHHIKCSSISVKQKPQEDQGVDTIARRTRSSAAATALGTVTAVIGTAEVKQEPEEEDEASLETSRVTVEIEGVKVRVLREELHLMTSGRATPPSAASPAASTSRVTSPSTVESVPYSVPLDQSDLFEPTVPDNNFLAEARAACATVSPAANQGAGVCGRALFPSELVGLCTHHPRLQPIDNASQGVFGAREREIATQLRNDFDEADPRLPAVQRSEQAPPMVGHILETGPSPLFLGARPTRSGEAVEVLGGITPNTPLVAYNVEAGRIEGNASLVAHNLSLAIQLLEHSRERFPDPRLWTGIMRLLECSVAPNADTHLTAVAMRRRGTISPELPPARRIEQLCSPVLYASALHEEPSKPGDESEPEATGSEETKPE